jgi:flagellar biosynthetic protein FliR
VAVSVDSRLLLVTLVLTFRLATFFALAPLMDRRSVPIWWRLVAAVPLAWAVAPAALATMPTLPGTMGWPHLVLEALNSLVIGAMLAFAINLVFAIVRFAGSLIGMQVGFAIVNAYDPQTESQISIFGQLYYLLAVLLLFALDAHLVIVRVLVSSIEVVPPFASPELAGGALALVRAYSQVFSLGLQLAAPVTLVLLLVSATMGVIVKTAPQIHVLVVGFPVKIAVGMFAVSSALLLMRGFVERVIASSTDLMLQVLEAMA